MIKDKTVRFWEIDTLRGIAVIMMIIYHILFNLNFFNVYNINLQTLPFQIFLYPIGTTFLLLVGLSLTLSYSRIQNELTKRQQIKKYISRGLMIFGFGLIITIITWLLIPECFIIFGVLHCIGISIIISYPFLKFKILNLLIGIILIIIGVILRALSFNFSWLLWVGLKPLRFCTLDYFPLLPWFGVVLIGIYLGNMIYSNNKRNFYLKDISNIKIIKFLVFLGQNSLLIYFIHQPIIILILSLLIIY